MRKIKIVLLMLCLVIFGYVVAEADMTIEMCLEYEDDSLSMSCMEVYELIDCSKGHNCLAEYTEVKQRQELIEALKQLEKTLEEEK